MSRCKSCAATIEWAATPKGSQIPLDPGLFADGNIALDAKGIAHIVPTGQGDRRAHFASCPEAKQHRRGRHPTRR